MVRTAASLPAKSASMLGSVSISVIGPTHGYRTDLRLAGGALDLRLVVPTGEAVPELVVGVLFGDDAGASHLSTDGFERATRQVVEVEVDAALFEWCVGREHRQGAELRAAQLRHPLVQRLVIAGRRRLRRLSVPNLVRCLRRELFGEALVDRFRPGRVGQRFPPHIMRLGMATLRPTLIGIGPPPVAWAMVVGHLFLLCRAGSRESGGEQRRPRARCRWVAIHRLRLLYYSRL